MGTPAAAGPEQQRQQERAARDAREALEKHGAFTGVRALQQPLLSGSGSCNKPCMHLQVTVLGQGSFGVVAKVLPRSWCCGSPCGALLTI